MINSWTDYLVVGLIVMSLVVVWQRKFLKVKLDIDDVVFAIGAGLFWPVTVIIVSVLAFIHLVWKVGNKL